MARPYSGSRSAGGEGDRDPGELDAALAREGREAVGEPRPDRIAIRLRCVAPRAGEHPSRLPRLGDVRVDAGELHRQGYVLDTHVVEPGVLDEGAQPGMVGKHEHARRPRLGGWGEPEPGEDPAGDRDPRVALGRAPDGEHQAAARAADAAG